MAFLRIPGSQPLPGDVRLSDGELQRYDLPEGWSADTVAFQGPWSEWRTYEPGDVVTDLHDLDGAWVLTDADADTWSCIALPAREEGTSWE